MNSEKLKLMKEEAVIRHLEEIDKETNLCKDKYLRAEFLKAKSIALLALTNIR